MRFVDKDEYETEQMKIIQKLARFKKKYAAYARPEQLQQTYEEAEKLEQEKTLTELQRVVIQKLKRKAQQKDSTQYVNEIIAKEKTWEQERLK